MIDLEAKFEVLEAEVKEINSNKETLKRNLLDLIELQHILSKTQVFFEEVSKLVSILEVLGVLSTRLVSNLSCLGLVIQPVI